MRKKICFKNYNIHCSAIKYFDLETKKCTAFTLNDNVMVLTRSKNSIATIDPVNIINFHETIVLLNYITEKKLKHSPFMLLHKEKLSDKQLRDLDLVLRNFNYKNFDIGNTSDREYCFVY